jgi:predicted  nucleic acid-binding Zn-ribbon protein
MSSNARSAIEHAISIINKSSSYGNKSAAISDILSGVRGFVETVQEGKKMASQIKIFESDIRNLEQQMETEENLSNKAKIKREIDGMKNTIRMAEQAKTQISSNRAILQRMQSDVEKLRSEINSALNH